ncbi:TenA family protein [Kaistia dalseonensis]|uniref:Thiaminase/transcriptional activator TenA n=1 Tax=Kaistia dalseonensis TaxID=410840 RepID=A0ABU0H195_9HYPH|nr:TenA family protein [Kaistia dalseonensis]MCX5493524.1 TenA family protein [Kaistia dalseonensis]MDQ0436084.1 thiaminase/transcriptional activator TenA [Kaistia dalseonensis]
MTLLFERLKRDAAAEWDAYVHHEFVRDLGDGTLPKPAFQHYLVQDYLFLIEFARAYAIALYKAPSLTEMRKASAGIQAILDETSLHLRLCASWGLDAAAVEATPEARATIAYTRFVQEAGLRGDILDILIALSPCVVGYAEIGAELAQTGQGLDGTNPYADWIHEYAGSGYQAVAQASLEQIERLAGDYLTEARYPRLLATFRHAVRLEADFWQMGLSLAD